MFRCEICGKKYKADKRCYVKKVDGRSGRISYLVVCEDCKYGE